MAEEGDSSVEYREEAEENGSESSGSEWEDWDKFEEEEEQSPLFEEIGEGEEARTPEASIKRFRKFMDSEEVRSGEREQLLHEESLENLFDFPKDPERWSEKDLQELWADAPPHLKNPGWDPSFASETEWTFVKNQMKQGRDPPIAPFYLPFRKYYPAVPEINSNIKTPKAVIEELDRIEEFLIWVSYIFKDGSSYEGTVWDDLAHGKGVYVAEQGLVRYEGEWLRNMMEGHGVVEVDIPDVQPLPGSELEEIMRAQGNIIQRDYMSPEDREWLEMDMEDSYRLANGWSEIPFYENNVWIKLFGEKPEKGRYRYAGQWKQGRMHGCGVYEVNERPIIGRFYFGELVKEGPNIGCDEDTSMLHAGIAEVAAAKARMFVNKPDGMVREERGPYSDPQHPYMYEEDDVWMAPGFINQFYEVPDNWKTYAHEVDEERQMWLNSFYKSPLRIPMPAELEHWWSKDPQPEFVILKKEPEPDPEDPSKLVYTEDPLILHTKTGRLINFVEDEEHGVRLFWQPPLKEGEEVDPEKVEFLPLGFDEFYGVTEDDENEGGLLKRLTREVGKVCIPLLEKFKEWIEVKKKGSEMKLKLIEQELEFIEAELCLEEAIEDMEEVLEMKQKEEEKKMEMEQKDSKDTSDVIADQDGADLAENEEEEDDDDEDAPASFGSVLEDQDSAKNEQGNKPRKSPFATSSLLFSSSALVSTVPSKLQESFGPWMNKRGNTTLVPPVSSSQKSTVTLEPPNSVSFPVVPAKSRSLKAVVGHKHLMHHKTIIRRSHLHSLSQILLTPQACSAQQMRHLGMRILCGGPGETQVAPEEIHCLQDILSLSLHVPIHCLENIN